MTVEKARRLGRNTALVVCFALALWNLWDWIVERDFPGSRAWAVGFGVPLAILLAQAVVEALRSDHR